MLRYLFPLFLGLGGAAVLGALGLWQVQRLDWKETLLADLENRLRGVPVALPAAPDPEADRYLPVIATGTTGAEELHVLVSTKDRGAGFRIITAFDLGGRQVLLDRGFVPDAARNLPRPPVTLTVTGNLHWPDDRDSYTPQNDPDTNYWFARDLGPMAAHLGTEPLLIVARDIAGPDQGIMALPLDTAGIANNHLGYAVQWFGLAIVWLGMTAFLIRRISKRSP